MTTPSPNPISLHATDKALKALKRFDERSRLPDRAFAKVDEQDIHFLKEIGKGSFSSIFQIEMQGLSKNQPQESYALKCLRPDRVVSEEALTFGTRDLVLEAHILSQLDHENVIRLRGVAKECASKSCLEYKSGYFLILELLPETLDDRLYTWRRTASHLPGGRKKLLSGRHDRLVNAEMYGRMRQVATGVCEAMTYIHGEGIIVRDLKPGNVGFDANRTVKLFDFGLARSVGSSTKAGIAGTARYMAPETISGQGSALASDVYSFGLLLWQICTLQLPYEAVLKTCSRKEYIEQLIAFEYRPPHSLIPCKKTQKLITQCWDGNMEARPTFEKVRDTLASICNHTPRTHGLSVRSQWFTSLPKSKSKRINQKGVPTSPQGRESLFSGYPQEHSAATVSSEPIGEY